jgi:stress response protein SCP2
MLGYAHLHARESHINTTDDANDGDGDKDEEVKIKLQKGSVKND